MRTFLTLALSAVILSACTIISSGAEPADNNCTVTNSITNVDGLLHGVACTANSQCKYGICSKSANVLEGDTSIGICTKDCSCGPHSGCDEDNDLVTKMMTFKCARFGTTNHCALECKTDGDCQKVNPQLPHCIDSYPGYFTVGTKVCSRKAKP